MLQRALREAGYAATATAIGIRAGSLAERRLTGANAVMRRALMARRATMALSFQQAKKRN
jgi:hypothetical protein